MRPPHKATMKPIKNLIPPERIEGAILLLRGEKVMLDADLAAIYGVTTKHLNQQVRRNPDRFPPDFMFRLTRSEKKEVVTNCDHLARLRFSPHLPHAFTEHGALMLANALNSPRATRTSVLVVRTFVRLRRILASNVELARKLADFERNCDSRFRFVFDAIRRLMAPTASKRREIGFHTTCHG